jgi:hypothetical protein
MSMLLDFIGGAAKDMKSQLDRKAEIAEQARQRQEQRREAREDRALERKAIRDETPVYEGVEGDYKVTRFGSGAEERRLMSEGEYNQYLDENAAKMAAAERQGLLDGLTIEEKKANIAQRNARADLSRRTDPNRSSRDDEREYKLTDADALSVLGLASTDELEARPDLRDIFIQLRGQRLTDTQIEELRSRLRSRTPAAARARNTAAERGAIMFDEGTGTNLVDMIEKGR